MKVLTTDRLSLRSLKIDDSVQLCQAVDESWEHLSSSLQWATDKEKYTDPIYASKYLSRCENLFATKKEFTFGGFLGPSDTLILSIRIAPAHVNEKVWEICGFWCRTQYQNTGFIYEALLELLLFCKVDLGVTKLIAVHALDNLKSHSVLLKLGFQRERTTVDCLKIGGKRKHAQQMFLNFN